MTYSAIMNKLVHEVIDEVLKEKREGRVSAPPGAAYSGDFTAQHAD